MTKVIHFPDRDAVELAVVEWATIDRTLCDDVPAINAYDVIVIDDTETVEILLDNGGFHHAPFISGTHIPRDSLHMAQREVELIGHRKQQKIRQEKEAAIIAKIAEAIGSRAKIIENSLYVDDKLFYHYDIDIRETGSAWKSVKFRISVGSYGRGNRTSFPQKKDGSFSYDKIAAAIIGKADSDIRVRERLDRQNNNKAAVTELDGKLTYLTSWNVGASFNPEKPVAVDVRISLNLTPAKVLELDAALKQVLGATR
jgi:hypothetical protein